MLNELIYRCMGNLKYFSLLIAAGMFAACSDNLENAGNVNEGPKTGEGYVKVAINLPSVSSSRAFNESTDLNDGDGSEYDVKNGIIAFFEQAKTGAGVANDEKAAKLVKAYYMAGLTDNKYDTDNPNHVTATVTVQTLDAPLLSGENNQMYALVILNNGKNNSIVSVENDGKRLSFKSGDAPIILEAGTSTIDDLYGKWFLNTSDITSAENGFLMLNSPLYNGTNAQTLVPVTVSSDPDQAETANIYVERVVAKVDVSINTTSPGDYFTENNRSGLKVKKDGSIYTGDKVVFIDGNDGAPKLGWTLNVTNKNTKPLRDVSDVATWAGYDYADFIGNTAVYEEGTDPKISWKRIYWAIDNNYDATATDFNVYNETNKPEDKSWRGYSTSTTTGIVPQYCLENTAHAADVKNNNTTAVLIKATYWVDEIADTEDKSFFMIGDDAATVNTSDFLKRIEEKLSVSSESLSIKTNVDGGYYESAVNTEGVSGLRSLIEGIPENEGGTNYDNMLADLGTIRYYKDGGCYYYAVPIKHFTIDKPSGTIDDTNYLGAYGVVRNNWYQITINSVSGPGAPGVTDPGEGGVEDEEGYIECSINILSWAKRSQNVDL